MRVYLFEADGQCNIQCIVYMYGIGREAMRASEVVLVGAAHSVLYWSVIYPTIEGAVQTENIRHETTTYCRLTSSAGQCSVR